MAYGAVTDDVSAGRTALREMRTDDAIAAFQRALASEPENILAHLGLYEAFQVKGDRERAIRHQRHALEQQQIYFEKPAPPGLPMMLVVAVPGDWQANVPLEFLYPSLRVGIHKLYVGDGLPFPSPDDLSYDVIFNAVAESETSGPTLRRLVEWLPQLGRPVLNDPARVLALSRDAVARNFADLENALVPATKRVARAELPHEIASPLVVRPVGSHAGTDCVRIAKVAELEAYLRATTADEYYIAPYIDYRSADGFFRKYRIIFVDGAPYPLHLAISDRWMVHYYNALNGEEAWIRSEEERFLEDVWSVFGGGCREALMELARRVGLDYFGIDCGILQDDRLLVFEIDPAMIVHLGDPAELYPYKHRYVPRIPAALERLIVSRATG